MIRWIEFHPNWGNTVAVGYVNDLITYQVTKTISGQYLLENIRSMASLGDYASMQEAINEADLMEGIAETSRNIDDFGDQPNGFL
jgi:hypothetical protein